MKSERRGEEVSRLAHNQQIAGANPAGATNSFQAATGEAPRAGLPSDAGNGSMDGATHKTQLQSPRVQSAEKIRRATSRSRKSAADIIPIERGCIYSAFMEYPSSERIAKNRGINRMAALETVVFEQGIELRNGFGGPARKPMGRAGFPPPARTARGVA